MEKIELYVGFLLVIGIVYLLLALLIPIWLIDALFYTGAVICFMFYLILRAFENNETHSNL